MIAAKKERYDYRNYQYKLDNRIDKQRTKRPLSPVLTSCLLVIALVIMGVTVVYRQAIIHSHNQQLHQMKNSYTELIDEQNHLNLEMARLGSLTRIDTIATEQLGLRKPSPEQIILVNRGNWNGDGN